MTTATASVPGSVRLGSRELRARAAAARELLRDCTLCGRLCHVDRLAGQRAFCRSAEEVSVSSATPHFGEEPPIVGQHGSGTIFFGMCNLRCVYCQNYQISQEGLTAGATPADVARHMLDLQAAGCHNINLVSPTHFASQIIEAVALAADEGLALPLVYNTGGYDTVELLELLDGIVDVYLPDMKYGDDTTALRLSKIPHYTTTNQAAVREMYRQVGHLETDADGVAQRGLIIRHLVLPHGLAGSFDVLDFLADHVSHDLWLSLMAQYHPNPKAALDPRLGRPITREEYDEVVAYAEGLGFAHFFLQPEAAAAHYRPDFSDPLRPFQDAPAETRSVYAVRRDL